MRFKIYFDCEKEIRLPKYYNSCVQNMIYNNVRLNEQFCNEEYIYKNERLDLFTFSKLNGRYKINSYTDEIVFTSPVEIILSSPIESFLSRFGYLMIICDDVYLGENQLKMTKLRVMEKPKIDSLELIYMLSPVVVYNTFIKSSGESLLHFYSPNDKEFSEIIEKDLREKFFMIHNYEPEEFQRISISPVKVEERLFRYNHDIEMRTWIGIFILEGSSELINIGYEAGIGCMNSLGFGCFEFIDNKRRSPCYLAGISCKGEGAI